MSRDVNVQLIGIKVPDIHPAGEVVPLLVKYHPEDPNAWATPDGGRVFGAREHAESAALVESPEHRQHLAKRAALKRLVAAEPVDCFAGWITVTGDDGDYFASVDELLDRYRDYVEMDGLEGEEAERALPAWCFCTTKQPFAFDLEDAIENYLDDNHHEGASDFLEDWAELKAFWTAWRKKQHLLTYFMDTRRVVVIDDARFAEERAAAQAWLEANP